MNIGFLLPSSQFYPYIGTDLLHTIKHFLGDEHNYIIKDSHLALPAENQKALKELILFENVDLVVGFIGYKSITAIKPLIQQTKTPLIICNSGEHPILKEDRSPYIVHSSLEMFNSIYFACKWAFNNIGHQYSRLTSFFEAGFPISFATELAANQNGGEIRLTETTHRNNDNDFLSIFNKIENENNDFVFMGSHGFDAIETFEHLAKYKSIQNTPIVSTPFFADIDLSHINDMSQVNFVRTWGNNDNDAFLILNTFCTTHLKREISFSTVLGYEVALILKHCISLNWNTNDEIASMLADFKVDSPRGVLSFNSELNSFTTDYFLFEYNKQKYGELNPMKQVDKLIPENSDWDLLNNFKEELSGWQNTYLCN